MQMQDIVIHGAREHNLKNVTLSIPKHKLVVLTGPSGSGKSTLAMDTLQRECQRQYMESMGMVSDTFSKPKVDAITGLSPSISVGQHNKNRNPRSTVGTVTDIHDYLRFLYSRLGQRSCPACGAEVVERPDWKGSVSSAEAEESQAVQCPACRTELTSLTMSHFSFNKPEGAREGCGGLGQVAELRMDAVFNKELSLREGAVAILYENLIDYYGMTLKAAGQYYGFGFDLELPLKDYSPQQLDLLYYGVESEQFMRHFPDKKPPKTVSQGKFEGIVTGMWRRYKEKNGEQSGLEKGDYFHQTVCPSCNGAKLNRQAREVLLAGNSLPEVSALSLRDVVKWTESLNAQVNETNSYILEPVLLDLTEKLRRMIDVGLGYLSLDRQSITLSGGEAQRLRLAALLGSGLTGVLYVMDEPTTGLHPRDTDGLIRVMKRLRDLGNTVLVIEHDPDVMRAADHIIDIGPGAGSGGGMVVGEGTLSELLQQEGSVTGANLRREAEFRIERIRSKGTGQFLTINGARARNLKNIDVAFPLGCLSAVTGVSGSGKSTLVFELLAGATQNGGAAALIEGCDRVAGLEHVQEIVLADQTAIGRMQRSNVATYSDVFAMWRNLFAALPEAKKRKLSSKHFSFNTAGGRCDTCEGLGVIAVDMSFLPDAEIKCPVCRGKRFKDEVLQVTWEGRSISDLLDMTVQDTLALFAGHPKAAAMIELLCEVGLGYLQWGQSVKTVSGGEGQRLKLAKELSRKTTHHTLYLLDEPTTGLHPVDIDKLYVLLRKLVDAGNTVIVVEHSMELVREADWVVDIGPEGGEAGGGLVAAGTPEEIAACAESHTGKHLRQALKLH
jgi:excinuclease ABC, A subunit